MTTPDTEQLNQVVRKLWHLQGGVLRSLQPLRLAGYCLLLLGLFDLAEILIPPVLLNPRWEFNAFGQIIERVPVMLIGLGFVFVGGHEERMPWESLLIKALSWLCLVAGVLYLLLMPLGVVNAIRIDRQNQQQVQTQTAELQAQANQAREQLASVQTEEDLVALVQTLSGQTVSAVEGDFDITSLKQQVNSSIEQNESSLLAQAKDEIGALRRELLEKSVKWLLGALVTGFIYILIWRSTGWARRSV